MKSIIKSLAFVLFLVVLSSCAGNKDNKEDLISTDVINNPKSAQGTDKEAMPEIQFAETTHDFGRVIEGEIVSYNFKFENTGNSKLLISSVNTSCGCTASDYPSKPIEPGEEGIIKLSFNSNHRKGFQSKTAVVMTNTQPNKTTLRIKAMVENPEN